MIEGDSLFSFLFLLCFTASHYLTRAQFQDGFISLDCGLEPTDETYTEKTTNIIYTSDAQYINTGENHKVDAQYQSLYQQQAWSLRSFPEGNRNCYSLNLTKDDKYLIRATFLYGNYDGLNSLPKFDLYIGTSKWTTVEIQAMGNLTMLEVIHVLTSDLLQVCLGKNGSTVPFISSLELRPLKNDIYVTQSGSLSTFARVFLSSDANLRFLRYDEDIHDRVWLPYFNTTGWTHLSTTNPIVSDGVYDPPQLALRTAATPRDDTEPLKLTWNLSGNPSSYIYMHFAEIELLKENETRVFNITYNGGKLWYSYFQPPNFTDTYLFNPRAIRSDDGRYEFLFTKAENSTRPPLINAIEIYSVLDLQGFETEQTDVDAITRVKEEFDLNKVSWQGDPCLPREYLWDGLNCSDKNTNAPRIVALDLSSNGLTGPIAPSIKDLTDLRFLDLSNNSLTGDVPAFLGEMKALEIIDLRKNNLNGSIPEVLLPLQKAGKLKVDGNLVPGGDTKDQKKKSFVVPVVASVASGVAVIFVLVILYVFLWRGKKTSGEPSVPGNHNRQPGIQIESTNRRFAYPDIVQMTNNFQRALGKGGFGTVYHGYLNDREEVAVKLLSHSSSQGYKQFKSEVELLLRVHHRNLVNLVGFCDEGEHLALIYEYMSNGDLREHLSGNRGTSLLSWASRLQIAVDSAQGLEYLHNGCKPQMVHRDVKTTNILLDEKFQAKLADFGLSRSFQLDGQSHVSTAAVGTPGYVDPEYFRTNILSEKSDVYSFGIVLLEIITNQSVIDSGRQNTYITEWVRVMIEGGDIMKIVDERLRRDADLNTLWRVVELAMGCVNPTANRRPTMAQVVSEWNDCLMAEGERMKVGRGVDSTGEPLDLSISEYAPHAR